MAVEAYSRQVIKKDRLGSLAKELDLPDLYEAQLVELAEAARRGLLSLSVLTHRLKGDTSPLAGLLPANAVCRREPLDAPDVTRTPVLKGNRIVNSASKRRDMFERNVDELSAFAASAR